MTTSDSYHCYLMPICRQPLCTKVHLTNPDLDMIQCSNQHAWRVILCPVTCNLVSSFNFCNQPPRESCSERCHEVDSINNLVWAGRTGNTALDGCWGGRRVDLDVTMNIGSTSFIVYVKIHPPASLTTFQNCVSCSANPHLGYQVPEGYISEAVCT